MVCKKGDYLFKQYDETKDLYIIKSGQVRVYKVEGGVEIDLDVIGVGGIVGEIAIIDGGKRSASVVALEDTEAFLISEDDFAGVSAKIPDWFQKIAFILAHRLREADAKIDRNMETDKLGHVAAAISLISYSDHCQALENGMYEIGMKVMENEVVDLLNIKYSDATAAFEKLQKQNLLRFEKGKAIIVNRNKIDEIAKSVLKTPASTPET